MTTLCARLMYYAWSQSWVMSLAMKLAHKALDHGVWCAHRWHHWGTIVFWEGWILLLNTTHANLLFLTNKAGHVTFAVNMKQLAWFVKGIIHPKIYILTSVTKSKPVWTKKKDILRSLSVFFVDGIQCCLVPIGKIIWNIVPNIFFFMSHRSKKGLEWHEGKSVMTEFSFLVHCLLHHMSVTLQLKCFYNMQNNVSFSP